MFLPFRRDGNRGGETVNRSLDFDLLTEEQFQWCIQQTANLAVSKAYQSKNQSEMFNWRVSSLNS